MRLVQLRAKEVKTVNTKFGERILIVASGDLKSEIKIWRPIDDTAIQDIRPNQFFAAAADSQGKYSPIAPVEPTQEPYIPESPYSPLATMPKPVLTNVAIAAPVETQIETETSGGAYDRHIENLAAKIADCYRATKKQLPELSEETIQKLATSVFIQLARDTF
jgi:hypothetical protein